MTDKKTEVMSCKIGRAPASVLLLLSEAWFELCKAGVSDGVPYAWDHQVFWIEHRGKPVTCLTVNWQEWNGLAFIVVGYTQQKHRRNGLYRRLYEHARDVAREKGFIRIAGGVSPKNAAMAVVAEALGRLPVGVQWEERLDED